MTWKGEKQRHYCSSKGVKTVHKLTRDLEERISPYKFNNHDAQRALDFFLSELGLPDNYIYLVGATWGTSVIDNYNNNWNQVSVYDNSENYIAFTKVYEVKYVRNCIIDKIRILSNIVYNCSCKIEGKKIIIEIRGNTFKDINNTKLKLLQRLKEDSIDLEKIEGEYNDMER